MRPLQIVFPQPHMPPVRRVRFLRFELHWDRTPAPPQVTARDVSVAHSGFSECAAMLTPQTPRLVADGYRQPQNPGTRPAAQVHPMLSCAHLADAHGGCLRRAAKHAIYFGIVDEGDATTDPVSGHLPARISRHTVFRRHCCVRQQCGRGCDWDTRFPWVAGSFCRFLNWSKVCTLGKCPRHWPHSSIRQRCAQFTPAI